MPNKTFDTIQITFLSKKRTLSKNRSEWYFPDMILIFIRSSCLIMTNEKSFPWYQEQEKKFQFTMVCKLQTMHSDKRNIRHQYKKWDKLTVICRWYASMRAKFEIINRRENLETTRFYSVVLHNFHK